MLQLLSLVLLLQNPTDYNPLERSEAYLDLDNVTLAKRECLLAEFLNYPLPDVVLGHVQTDLYSGNALNALNQLQRIDTTSNPNLLQLINYNKTIAYHTMEYFSVAELYARKTQQGPDANLAKQGVKLEIWTIIQQGKYAQALSKSNKLDTTKFYQELKSISAKRLPNPQLANTLSSFIPGAGQIYAGQYWNGIWSFLLHGVIITAIVNSIDKERYYDAFLIYPLVRFYGGNKYNAKAFTEAKLYSILTDNAIQLSPLLAQIPDSLY